MSRFLYRVGGASAAHPWRTVAAWPVSLVAARPARDAGLQVELSGEVAENVRVISGATEAIGVVAALVILFLAVRSVVAAGPPITVAFVGLGVDPAGIMSLVAFTDVSTAAPTAATTVGLVVGIDSVLLLVNPFPEDAWSEPDGRRSGRGGVRSRSEVLVTCPRSVKLDERGDRVRGDDRDSGTGETNSGTGEEASGRTRRFYDGLAGDYHLIFADWDASVRRQGAALHRLVTDALGPGPHRILDCACGIGTQAIGLAGHGHRVVGTDLSPVAAGRATAEATARGHSVPTAAADMRALPVRDATVDAVVCADNSLPHLLTGAEVGRALAEARRVLRPGGLLIVSTRDYDALRAERPTATLPGAVHPPDGRAVTFQLWHWHDDGERYDLEHFQLRAGPEAAASPEAGAEAGAWTVVRRTATYWAVPRGVLTGLAVEAGLREVRWRDPAETGFFQPLFTARR